VGKYTNDNELYKMAIKYSLMAFCTIRPFQGPPIIYPNWDFFMKMKI
jgi:hypothetical protein